jgi:hypothetical protein
LGLGQQAARVTAMSVMIHTFTRVNAVIGMKVKD